MPQRLAQALLVLRPRILHPEDNNAWFLAWQLLGGAAYSLHRAATLLPHQGPDLTAETNILIDSLAQARLPAESQFSTWLLGCFLNSSELRIQAGLHRILKAYTGATGHESALTLAETVLGDPQAPPLHKDAEDILRGFTTHARDSRYAGASLYNLWDRTNSLKHQPGQDMSDHIAFRGRVDEDTTAAIEVLRVLEVLGERSKELSAA